MATASEGEALVGIDQINLSVSTTTLAYTVPAGRYAKINMQQVVFLLMILEQFERTTLSEVGLILGIILVLILMVMSIFYDR